MNYASLQTSVAIYLHRSDLTALIPTFIELAESFLFRELRIKELETSVTGTTTSGYATLPADFGAVSRVSATYAGAARTLDYKLIADADTNTSTSSPGYYSLEKDQLRIWGASDGQAYTLYYTPLVAALSASNTTNWLIENAKELYLYASCLEGAKHIRDNAEVEKLTGMVGTSLDSVKRFAERRGQPATGSMQIKTRR